MLKTKQVIFATDKRNLRYYSDVVPADIIEKAIAGDSVITIELSYKGHKQLLPIYVSKIRSPDIPELYDTLIWEKKLNEKSLPTNLKHLKKLK